MKIKILQQLYTVKYTELSSVSISYHRFLYCGFDLEYSPNQQTQV